MDSLLEVCDTIIREETIENNFMAAYKDAVLALINLFTSCDIVKVEQIICSFEFHL